MKKQINQTNELPYKTIINFHEVFINYGTEAYTTSKVKYYIVSLIEALNEFYYYHSNDKCEVKTLNGFINQDLEFQQLRKFPGWSAGNSDTFLNLNSIPLKIEDIGKNEELGLHMDLEQKIGYLETIDKTNILFHYYYIRMQSETDGVVFTINIPKGKLSSLIRIKIEKIFKEKVIQKFEFINIKSRIDSLKNFGLSYIEVFDDIYRIKIISNKKLKANTLIKFTWFTKKIKLYQ